MRLFAGRYLYALQDVAFCSPKGHVSHGKRPRFAASFAVFYIVAFAVLVKKKRTCRSGKSVSLVYAPFAAYLFA